MPKELQEKLAANGDAPLVLKNPETGKLFFLQPDHSDLPIFRPENRERLRQEIQKGIDDFEAGRYSEWNLEEFKAEMRKRLQAREQSK